jgi:hypothetical protein
MGKEYIPEARVLNIIAYYVGEEDNNTACT